MAPSGKDLPTITFNNHDQVQNQIGSQIFQGPVTYRQVNYYTGPSSSPNSGEQKSALFEDRLVELVLGSLEYDSRTHRKRQLINVDDKSLGWLWEDEPNGAAFSKWLSHPSQLYWIAGNPGTGKSTLMKYLSRHPQTIGALRSGRDGPWTCLDFFFDFRARTGLANNLEGMLRSLLMQMVQADKRSANEVFRAAGLGDGIFGDSDEADAASLPAHELQQLICDFSTTSMHHFCAFIDGADEFEGSQLELCSLTKTLARDSKLKICLASRPETILVTSFKDYMGFEVQKFNRPTVERFVRDRMQHFVTQSDIVDLNELAEQIITDARGGILWARLAVDELLDGHFQGESKTELSKRLRHLPGELRDFYHRILESIDEHHQSEAKVLLGLISTALEPLLLSQLRGLLQLLSEMSVISTEWNTNLTHEILVRKIYARTKGFLDFVAVDNGLQVRLLHQSLIPFVNGLDWQGQQSMVDKMQLRFDGEDDEPWLRLCCFSVQKFENELGNWNPRYEHDGPRVNGTNWYIHREIFLRARPILFYTLQYLFEHAFRLEKKGLSTYHIWRPTAFCRLLCLHMHAWGFCGCLTTPAPHSVNRRGLATTRLLCAWNSAIMLCSNAPLQWSIFHSLFLSAKSAFDEGFTLGAQDGQALLTVIVANAGSSENGDANVHEKMLPLVLESPIELRSYHYTTALTAMLPLRLVRRLVLQHVSRTNGWSVVHLGDPYYMPRPSVDVDLLFIWLLVVTDMGTTTAEYLTRMLRFFIDFELTFEQPSSLIQRLIHMLLSCVRLPEGIRQVVAALEERGLEMVQTVCRQCYPSNALLESLTDELYGLLDIRRDLCSDCSQALSKGYGYTAWKPLTMS